MERVWRRYVRISCTFSAPCIRPIVKSLIGTGTFPSGDILRRRFQGYRARFPQFQVQYCPFRSAARRQLDRLYRIYPSGTLRPLPQRPRGTRRHRILYVRSRPHVECREENALGSRCSLRDAYVRRLRRMMPPVSLATPVIQNCACHSECSVSVVKNLKQIAGDSSCSFGMTQGSRPRKRCHSDDRREEESPVGCIKQ